MNRKIRTELKGIYYFRNKDSNKLYIGSSKDVIGRLRSHINELLKNEHTNTHLQNSFNLHGLNSFEWGILEFVNNQEDLLKVEDSYIEKFQKNGELDSEKVYNFILNSTRRFSDETRKKMSDVRKGRKLSEEHIEKMRFEGKNRSFCAVKDYYRNLTEEQKKQYRDKVILGGIKSGFIKRISQFTSDGTFINSYESISDGARSQQFDTGNISKAIKNGNRYKKYFWKLYEEGDENGIQTKKYLPYKVYNDQNELIGEFGRSIDVGNLLGVSGATIRSAVAKNKLVLGIYSIKRVYD